MSTTIEFQHPRTALSGTFPPAWRLGQEWHVVCKTRVPKADMPLPDPPVFGDVFFRFRVTEVPNDKHAHYRVDAFREDSDFIYALFFRTAPFSLARFEERHRGGLLDSAEYGTTPSAGRASNRLSRLLVDFPIMPPPDRLFGPAQFKIDDQIYTQTIEPTVDGIRATVESEEERIVFLWKKGDPWWSSVERSNTPYFRDKVDRTFTGSGRLLP